MEVSVISRLGAKKPQVMSLRFLEFSQILIIVFPAIWMTFHAILEIGDPFLHMLRADIRLVVFVASVAGIGFISSGVTRSAGRYAAFTVIQREAMLSIEGGRSPCGGSVAGNAIRTEISSMLGWLSMTGKTGRIQSLELTVRMALLASHIHVRPGQREVGKAVVKGCAFPIVRGVTGGAIRAEFAVVFVILLMTGIAIGRCALELIIDVTLLTGNFRMFAFEFESRKVVIEFRGLPTVGAVTGGAILPKPAVVLVILLVARETILRRRLQINKGTRIEVTFCTSRFGMFAAQLKCKRGMGKVAPKPVHAIVTGEAVRAESQKMRLGKGDIHLTVTSVTGGWGEGCDILLVAGITVCGCAFEDVVHMALFAFCFGVFAFEFESRKVVVELRGLPAFG